MVYSTEHGRMCPRCGQPAQQCHCKQTTEPVRSNEKIHIRRETKHRRGKTVTIIAGLALPQDKMRELSLYLKQKLGTGGTVKNDTILIQGDHAVKIKALLNEKGYTNISGP